MPESEKITINMWPVDLGQIDLLVDQGFYSNRTDFIRIAIRNQLQSHHDEVKQYTTDRFFVMGVLEFDKARLEETAKANKQLDIKLVGALIISNDVPIELAMKTFHKVKLYGILRAPADVKRYIQSL